MKYKICVVGAGGTGSYFLKEISRYIAGNKAIEGLYVFDGDTVEQKNLARQSFMEDDIGRNKAVVMAEALNEAFGLSWKAYAKYVSSVNDILDVVDCGGWYGRETIPILVSCVDNHGCRLIMEEAFSKLQNCVYLDSANEFVTGEVVYSYRMGGQTFGPARSFYFPEIKKGDVRNREEISCEELNRVEPQHIFTNMMAGNLLCTGVSNFLQKKSTPGVCYFNAARMSCRFVDYVPVADVKGEKKEKRKNEKEKNKEKRSSAGGRRGRAS